MRVNKCIGCQNFPCQDVRHAGYVIPNADLDPQKVKIAMISEAAPENPDDYYYAAGEPLFQQTTLLAFQDAGAPVKCFPDILDLGVYLTSAVKCAKTGYGIQTATVVECSHILERELTLFPNIQVYLLMGDVAIKALNLIAKRTGEPRVIPSGSTYKLRAQKYYYRGRRAFPSYLQAGPSFFIEKTKRKMIAEDITQALQLLS